LIYFSLKETMMLFFDLQRLLFAGLLILIAAVALAVWLDRRQRRRQPPNAAEIHPVLERAPFGWLVLDGRHTCRYANPTARRLLDLPATPCQLPDAGWVRTLNADRVAARLEPAAGRYRTVTLSEDRAVRWWITPAGNRDVVFLLDITTQQRAEQAARSLLSDLSHELRTPLGTILTHLEVLRLPDIDTATGEQSLRLLKEETQRMARLVNHMLALGRLETSADIERRPVELLPLVQDVVTQVTPDAEAKTIELTLEADAPLPPVVGDADRLRQAFLNLLENAIHPLPSGRSGGGLAGTCSRRHRVRGAGHRPGHPGGTLAPRDASFLPRRPATGTGQRPGAGPGGRDRAPARQPAGDRKPDRGAGDRDAGAVCVAGVAGVGVGRLDDCRLKGFTPRTERNTDKTEKCLSVFLSIRGINQDRIR